MAPPTLASAKKSVRYAAAVIVRSDKIGSRVWISAIVDWILLSKFDIPSPASSRSVNRTMVISESMHSREYKTWARSSAAFPTVANSWAPSFESSSKLSGSRRRASGIPFGRSKVRTWHAIRI